MAQGVLQTVERKQTASTRQASNITTTVYKTFQHCWTTQSINMASTVKLQSSSLALLLTPWHQRHLMYACMLHSCTGPEHAVKSLSTLTAPHILQCVLCCCIWSKEKLKIYTNIAPCYPPVKSLCCLSVTQDWLCGCQSPCLSTYFAFVLYSTSVKCTHSVPHFLPLPTQYGGPIWMMLQPLPHHVWCHDFHHTAIHALSTSAIGLVQ